ncbi:hypothetical protein H5410_060766 [Solanum commersonii]|uniref:Uncharacterized protein n=1 Tax=Solanum commersonii TaxID=4109 RepID=A0A9J5W730_SOLCO|nr:hypothetical protein H5410_060766 [Solanum commersonii]
MTTTGTFTGIVTIPTPCVAITTTSSATINGVSTTSTVIALTLEFMAVEEVEEEEVVFSVASLAALLGCDPE